MIARTLKKTLPTGLALIALAAAGCGDDDDQAASERTETSSPAQQSPPPAKTTPADEEPTAAAGAADKLRPEQRQELLVQNNEAALGEGGHVEIAENYRAVAKPLAEGECKRALGEVADAEEAFGKALEAGEPLPLRQKLGQQVLKRADKVNSVCY